MISSGIGALIAEHRRRCGLSQARFAALMGRSVSWVSQVERGIKPLERIPVLLEVARVLEVPPVELLPDAAMPDLAMIGRRIQRPPPDLRLVAVLVWERGRYVARSVEIEQL